MIMMAQNLLLISGLILLFNCLVFSKKTDDRECEVCIGAVEKFQKQLTDADTDLEKAFRAFCKALPKGGKENRFCYFVGGTEDAATGMLKNLLDPLRNHVPIENICKKKLKKIDAQICELRYDKKPDFSKLDKMRVNELKKILSNWGEDMACKGCLEKPDFVSKVKELLPKYEPEEYQKLKDKQEL